MRIAALAAMLLLAACSGAKAPRPVATGGPALEAAAIRAGVIDDPAAADLTGLYARDNDRLCVVPDGGAFRVGVALDYGDGQACSGSGSVARSGESLHIRFAAAPNCEFDARSEGDRILFPGALPDACQSLCSRRATMTGLIVDRLSESPSEAAALRDTAGHRPCG